MMESMSGSGVRPRRAARSARILAGQVANIREIAGSGTQLISELTSGPAIRSSAAAISATDTVSAGMVTAVRPPHASPDDVAARISLIAPSRSIVSLRSAPLPGPAPAAKTTASEPSIAAAISPASARSRSQTVADPPAAPTSTA